MAGMIIYVHTKIAEVLVKLERWVSLQYDLGCILRAKGISFRPLL